jgi:hypothetical protein
VSERQTPGAGGDERDPERDRDDTPDTPPTEPPPVPVEDPPAEPGPEGPYVEEEPWTECVKSVVDSRRCRPRSSVKLRAKAGGLHTKKVPRTSGRLKKRGTPAEREDRSAVVDVDGWYRRHLT